MTGTDCDIVIIGTGPGGESLAGRLASDGLHVVAVESGLVGGECPFYGCVPSKTIVRAANALQEARRLPELAGWAKVQPDYAVVAQRIRDDVTDHWDDQVAADRLVNTGAQLVRGHGRLVAPRTVAVGDRSFTARIGVVLNTGTDPAVPNITGLADTPFWTNRDIVKVKQAPASMIVIGGGASGLEFAQAFRRFGTAVTVVESGQRLLGHEERESSDVLRGVFLHEGIAVREGAQITSVTHHHGEFEVCVGEERLRAERLLVSAGRVPRTADLGLETVGVGTRHGYVDVDDQLEVGDGLWAIGDITGRGAFTHVSMYQSARLADVILCNDVGPYDSSSPRVTFTDPEVGAVGLTERQARDAGIDVRVAKSSLPDSSRGWIHRRGNAGFIKTVIDQDRGLLVGATSVGPTGGETLSMLALAVHAQIPLATLRNMVYAYPTFYRAIESAL